MKYRFVVTYRSSYRKWSVKVLFPMNEGCDEYKWYNQDVEDMNSWCEKTGLGRRMAYDEFMFDNEANATIFVLKFS